MAPAGRDRHRVDVSPPLPRQRVPEPPASASSGTRARWTASSERAPTRLRSASENQWRAYTPSPTAPTSNTAASSPAPMLAARSPSTAGRLRRTPPHRHAGSVGIAGVARSSRTAPTALFTWNHAPMLPPSKDGTTTAERRPAGTGGQRSPEGANRAGPSDLNSPVRASAGLNPADFSANEPNLGFPPAVRFSHDFQHFPCHFSRLRYRFTRERSLVRAQPCPSRKALVIRGLSAFRV